MSSRFLKATRSILVDGNLNRLWQVVNKSPLVNVMSFLQNSVHIQTLLNRKKYLQQINLNTVQKNILNNLDQNGFAMVNDLFNPMDYSQLEVYLKNKLALAEVAKQNQKVKTKSFWVRLSDTDDTEEMTTLHPLVELSIKPALLEVVAKYLKTAPFLQSVVLTHSIPSQKPLSNSQLWHFDFDGDRMLKFFIYLSDVNDEADGPFTMISKNDSSKIKNSFFARHLNDDEVQNFIDLSKVIKIKGSKWSAFLVDTHRCYHMGSRVEEGHERLMTTSLYIGLPSPYPGATKRKIKIESDLNFLQRQAIEV